MQITTLRLAAIALSLILVACWQGPGEAQGVGGVSVSRTGFVRDGVAWIPQGFSLVGRVAPRGRSMNAIYDRARGMYGPKLFQQARSLGANTLRIQVSQPGLDAQSAIFDPSYAEEVIDSVRQARAAGFVVIVSMQWEGPSGLKQDPMPGQSTLSAWSRIAGAFATDGYVMLELFNEPAMQQQNPQAWPVWQSGMQAVVHQVRAAGARNVLILDGIQFSHVLAGAPPIHDPLNKLAYAVHPYFHNRSSRPADWDAQWGQFAASHPVLVSEWNMFSRQKACRPDQPAAAQQLMDYLSRRRIGVMVWALDLPQTVFDDAGQPLGLQNFTCGVPGSGATSMALQYMRSSHP